MNISELYHIRSLKRTVRLIFLKLLSKCSVKLHPYQRTMKTKVAFLEQLSWLFLVFEVTSDAILGKANRVKNKGYELSVLAVK